MPDGVYWHWGKNGWRTRRQYWFKHKGVPSIKRYTTRAAAQVAYEGGR